MRNPPKAQNEVKKRSKDDDEDEENYSDEEIANDPDEGDDGTKELIKIKKTVDPGDNDEHREDDEFEESPRQKISSQGALTGPRSAENAQRDVSPDEAMEDDEELNEDEVIDVAEQLFVRIAQAIIELKVKSIRSVFAHAIFEVEIDGQVVELLPPMGLLEGIKSLGIEDMTEKETTYLLRVLTKPELDNAIVMPEFLQIMENLGLYEDEEQDGEADQD